MFSFAVLRDRAVSLPLEVDGRTSNPIVSSVLILAVRRVAEWGCVDLACELHMFQDVDVRFFLVHIFHKLRKVFSAGVHCRRMELQLRRLQLMQVWKDFAKPLVRLAQTGTLEP